MSYIKVESKKAPIPNGHYVQGVNFQNLIFTSVQLASDQESHNKLGVDIQARMVLKNIESIIQAGGSNKAEIFKVTIYVTDIRYWPIVNNEYKTFFGKHKPARGVIPVTSLHQGFSVAMEAIAGKN